MSITMERAIRQTQRYTVISMDICGECIERESSKCRTMNFQLRKNIAVLIGCSYTLVEVVKPMYISHGLSMDIIIYINDDKKKDGAIKQLLKRANKEGNLAKIIKHAWKLDAVPKIKRIREQTVESSQTRKRLSTVDKSKQSVDLHTNDTHPSTVKMTTLPSKSSFENDGDLPTPPVYNPNARRATRKDTASMRKQTYSDYDNVPKKAYDDGSELMEIGKEGSPDINKHALDKNEVELSLSIQDEEDEGPPPPDYNPNASIVSSKKLLK